MAASTFSYAQAAKGLSTPIASSKPTSGVATPAKDTSAPASANGSVDAVPSWADEAESEAPTEQSTSTVREAPPQAPVSTPTQPAPSVDASSISSPDLGASSVSTVTKDDDVSSLPNASSESTWDNKSQASTSVDKSVEPVEKTSEKVKKGKNVVTKPLQEAPLPAVNIWKKRADEAKSKIQKPSPSSLPHGALSNNSGASTKKSDSDTRGQSANLGAGRTHGRDDEKNAHARKDARTEAESKKDGRVKVSEKDSKPAAASQLPPPKRDQEAWPTPETVINEDRKKAQEKGDKEQKDNASTGGKHEWVKVPYTPSVVFHTPLPNAANTRRGGRGGGRGGAQTGGRPTPYGTNGAGQSEKDGSAPATVTNGDHTKRERTEGAAPRDASPKSKRTGIAASPTLKDQAAGSVVEKSSKIVPPPGSENDFRPRTASSAPDSSQSFSQSNSYPRQYPNRSVKPQRSDMAFTGERRKDGDVSPTKDNTFDDRRNSAATQTDVPGEGERRSTYHDGTNGHSHKSGRFGSYSNGRERGGRGGARGGRGNYANGHQYSNGHMPSQSSSSFTMGPRSPTTFNPENPSFFSSQGKYGRSGHRSQSVTTDPYRFAPYQAGPPVAPLQTYSGVYDYSMMQQPMSAVPYTPYVDQFALFSMITTQVEYYFSVDNLLKDMYLRRRMDSQGFVSLEFIAGFNRIRHLSTDIELIKLVCQQSSVVQYRTGEDGQDRLRRREGWEQWVLNMADRDEIAQNEGPKELRHPAVARPNGFDPSNTPQWPMSAVEPSAHYGNHAAFPQMNGYSHGGGQDGAATTEDLPSGTTPDGSRDGVVPNGHPVEASTKAVSSEPDSFSDTQIASLTVIVRQHDQLHSAVPSLASRTYSNGSVDSKYGVQDALEEMTMCQVKVNGTGFSESNASDIPVPCPSASPIPVQLYWVKDQVGPVHAIPSDFAHESYYDLRSKALQQRLDASAGTNPYDMDVLYQFWSHFLIRNFNLSMYNEFRHFAFEDATHRKTDVGLLLLVKYYGESLSSSSTTVIRDCVARYYVDLVEGEKGHRRPAFQQLRSSFRTGNIDSRNRIRVCRLLDRDWLASMDS